MTVTTKSQYYSVSSILICAAFLSAIFYHGVDIGYLIFTKACLVLLAAGIFWNTATQNISLSINKLNIAAALFWLYLILNIPLGHIPENNSYAIWLISLLPITFFLYQLANVKHSQWNYLLASFIIIATGLSVHYLYQIITNNLPYNGGGASFFPNRNTLAALLNLTLLATGVSFIKLRCQRQSLNIQIALGAAIFLMTYAMTMTQSRGGFIAFFASHALLFALLYKKISTRILLSLFGILLAGIFLTTISLEMGIGATSDLINNLSSIKDPSNAGSSRFLIWESVWRMIQEAPWLGHGAGTFSLLYPQYRVPADVSGGLFVHNDYLQIWVEMGLPAIILLVTLFIITAFTFINFWRANNDLSTRLEVGGLFCALFSITLHSIFTFNLYILSILILSGLFLGRLNQLCIANTSSFAVIVLQKYLKPSLIKPLILIATLIVLASLLSSWAHQYYYQRAIAEHSNKQFGLANESFALSSQLKTTYASLVSHASLLSDSIETWPKSNTDKRQLLYTKALQYLDNAKDLNPLRPSQYNIRAHLYSAYPKFSDANYLTYAKEAYIYSLKLNPRQFKVRYLLAKLLLSEKNPNQALMILEDGLKQPTSPWENTVPYLQLTMSLRQLKGDKAGAQELARSIENQQRIYKSYLERKKSP